MKRFALLFCLGCLACETESDVPVSPEQGSVVPTMSPELAVHEEHGDGTWTSAVDSTHEGRWVLLDLETREAALGATDGEPLGWDLGFQRFKIMTNSGISGDAGTGTVRLEDTSWDEVTEAPADGYVADAEDGDDEDSDPDLAFMADGAWYDYDFATHTLSPRDHVYVVRTASGNYFKVQVLGYYDVAGTPGLVTFRWAQVDASR